MTEPVTDPPKGDGGENNNSKSKLHPILITPDKDDDNPMRAPFRPRANTDPVSPRPRNHVHFNLPEIVVDDCSDSEENDQDDEFKELANTSEGAFFVFTSPPRQRSNTCPVNMFSRRRLARPPTPPPNDVKSRNGVQKHSSKEKLTFSPHTLSRVTEDSHSSDVKHSHPRPIPQRKTSNPGPSSSPGVASSLEGRKTKVAGKQYSKGNSDIPSGSPGKGHIKRGGTGVMTRDVMAA